CQTDRFLCLDAFFLSIRFAFYREPWNFKDEIENRDFGGKQLERLLMYTGWRCYAGDRRERRPAWEETENYLGFRHNFSATDSSAGIFRVLA
ncbi:MAG: hypothetical protein PHV82_17325, partial [Victivallaceae bacterium]|nr:hypothetical protein [Victivallaceae bacterium]